MASLELALAADLERNANAYARDVLDRVRRDEPALLSDRERGYLAAEGTEGLLHEFAAGLRLGVGGGFHAPSAATAFAAHLARDGVPLASVLRSYRLGQEVLVTRAADLVGDADEPDPPGAVARVVALSFRFADAAMTDIATVYEEQREATLRADTARREELVARIVAGAEVEPRAAALTLGYRLDRAHVALLCWRVSGGASADAFDVLSRLARALGLGRPLVVSEPGGAAGAWVGRGEPLGAHELDSVEREIAGRGLGIAVGAPARGLAGFARSRQQADQARSVAALRPALVVRYSDVALLALLLQDRVAAEAFAHEELAGLAGAGRTAQLLRTTVAAFFAAGHDRTRTARSLSVHRNTVARRLARAETIIGHPLNERVRELETALTIVGAPAS